EREKNWPRLARQVCAIAVSGPPGPPQGAEGAAAEGGQQERRRLGRGDRSAGRPRGRGGGRRRGVVRAARAWVTTGVPAVRRRGRIDRRRGGLVVARGQTEHPPAVLGDGHAPAAERVAVRVGQARGEWFAAGSERVGDGDPEQ